jgi:type IV pilus assembly protein PilA
VLSRLQGQRGFTLVELLVVVLIIGILAAVALPTFLGQRDKGFDADAKSNARNVQTLVESCGLSQAGNYKLCDTALEIGGFAAVIGTTAGKVTIVSSGPDVYVITATSKAKTGAAYRKFIITRSLVPRRVVKSASPTGTKW